MLPERALFLECQACNSNQQQFPLKQENPAVLTKEEPNTVKESVEFFKRIGGGLEDRAKQRGKYL